MSPGFGPKRRHHGDMGPGVSVTAATGRQTRMVIAMVMGLGATGGITGTATTTAWHSVGQRTGLPLHGDPCRPTVRAGIRGKVA